MNRLDRLEIKETKKIMLLLITLVAAYNLLAVLCSVLSNISASDAPFIMKVILMMISALGVVCAAVIMIARFYGILFTDEGLMRFSYPVEKNAHLKTNVKCGLMWLFAMITIIVAGLVISDAVTKREVEDWGAGNLYRNLAEHYAGNYLSAPSAKALLTVIICLIALAVFVINIYISFIFTLTMSSRICGKYNILQKKGVIFITGIVMFNIHLITVEVMSRIGAAFYANYDWLDLFERDGVFVELIDRSLANIIVYGITAIVMYRISKTILDKKLDI
ncbi:MAG: hypothetical protein K5871_12350 [Lachnospiraceae bacterium]|nr:hypothetical protein [Lachnospiraceae bacterium]